MKTNACPERGWSRRRSQESGQCSQFPRTWVASPQSRGQSQRGFTVQDATVRNTGLEGKANVDSVDGTSLAQNKSRGHRANANSANTCAGYSPPLYPCWKVVLETSTTCTSAGRRLWFIFLIYPRSYFCSLKPSYLLYLARILECALG